MKFKDKLSFTSNVNYQVCVKWDSLESHINRDKPYLDINPDFQRCHVWTKKQQIEYIEYKIKGGPGGDFIYCNCPGWMNDFRGPYEVVDGKQRINAVLNFIRNKIKAFGYYYNQFEDRIPHYLEFIWHVHDLKTRKELLKWYLELNTKGTPHKKSEIEKVKSMLKNEK
jgi:hypothetical protein